MSNSTTTTYVESNEIQVGVKREKTSGMNYVSWYRMYAQQKIYKDLVLTERLNLKSSMIWGCQWDQIMIWMKSVSSKHINSTYTGKFYVTNSVSMGNFGIIDDVSDVWEDEYSFAPTGYSEDWKVKNVFDLAGNVIESTLETYFPTFNSYRVWRGSGYGNTTEGTTRVDCRGYEDNPSKGSVFGSRSVLY